MKLRVLVIDDDLDVLSYLSEFLTREGYQVTAIRDPRQALPEVKDGRHQIALLDVRMPELDGVTLLRQIRALDSDLCVIVMTGYPTVESAVDMMKAQAFDYLAKPFDAAQLREVLSRAIREKGLVVDPEERVNRLLGAKVRTLRKERDLTLRQLANKTGLSVSLISQIELGKSAASISTLWKLASALGVPASALLEGI
jgi:two-component system OmpR family response regulator